MAEPSWHPDPSGRFELRYWDGSCWTQSVSSGGRQATDPGIVDAPAPGEVSAVPAAEDASMSAPAVGDSAVPPGPGWWMASDGNWYPPAVDEAANASAPVAHGEAAASRKKLAIIGGAVGAVAIVVIAVLMLTGGGSGYPAEFRADFLDECTSTSEVGRSAAQSICKCAYQEIQREIPWERWEQAESPDGTFAGGGDRLQQEMSNDVSGAIRGCAREFLDS